LAFVVVFDELRPVNGVNELAFDEAGRAVGPADHCKICLLVVVLVAPIGSKGLLR
jgi:hypothetical protein